MAAGVTLVDPATTYIDVDVEVGPDTVIHPGVSPDRATRVGSACEIHPGVRVANSTIGDGVLIRSHCVIEDSTVAGDVPRLGRSRTCVRAAMSGRGAHVGNFVELKKTVLGERSKANHLAYLGDATIGTDVNIGAGTITCNYDGVKKHPTVIEDGVFVGTDSQLIAPVTLGRGSYVAAGSSITHDVPPGSLAISRGRQVNKQGWAERKKGK